MIRSRPPRRRRLRPGIAAIVVAALLALAPAADACLVCNSETGEEVRAGMLDENLARGVLATLLPFTVVVGVVYVMHRGGSLRRSRHDR